jgi:mRNA interferase RelE/StbE
VSDLYGVRLSPGAAHSLEIGPPRGLPVAAAFAVYEFLNGPLRQEPWRVSKPLHDELDGFRGARRGEYRVVLSIDEESRIVNVVRIDHRADVYR